MRQVVILTGEAPNITLALSEAVDQMGASVWALLAVFSIFGMLLNYSMFLCAMLNSALTTTIVGVLKVDAPDHLMPCSRTRNWNHAYKNAVGRGMPLLDC